MGDQQKVYEIYQMCEPKPKELLENTRRHFVHEGPVILWNERELKKKDRWFFLFNDVLLIAKRLNGAKMKYRLRVYITLRAQVKVVDVPDSSDVCEFRILAPTKTFVLFGRNKEEKHNWIRWITNVINGRPMNEGGDDKALGKSAAGKTRAAAAAAAAAKKTKKKRDDSDSEEAAGGSDEEEEEEEEEEESDEAPPAKPVKPTKKAATPVAATKKAAPAPPKRPAASRRARKRKATSRLQE